MRKRLMAVLTLICMSAAASAAAKAQQMPDKLPGKGLDRDAIKQLAPKPAPAPGDEVSLMIDVSAKYLELEGKTRFIAGNANQANYVTGSDKAFPAKTAQGEGAEFKKTGFIVNVLPVLDPNGGKTVSMQLQVELSGPSKGIQVGDNAVPDVVTWQWQSGFTMPLGKKTRLVDGPATLDVTVSKAE